MDRWDGNSRPLRPLHGYEYADYINSDLWRMKRARAIEYHGSKCNRCGEREQLQVHHKTYKRLGMEQMGDLEVLCECCHALEHAKKPKRMPKSGRATKPKKIKIGKSNRKKHNRRRNKGRRQCSLNASAKTVDMTTTYCDPNSSQQVFHDVPFAVD